MLLSIVMVSKRLNLDTLPNLQLNRLHEIGDNQKCLLGKPKHSTPCHLNQYRVQAWSLEESNKLHEKILWEVKKVQEHDS